jgi:hypothetical protein
MITIDTRAQALHYALRGWAVMPLLPKQKEPHFDLIKGAYLGATTDSSLINFWFDVEPQANIGIACITSGLIVIDIDYRNDGQLMDIMPETYTVQTGDGLHLYYKADRSINFKSAIRPGIDIKWKGYVAAAPSIHPNGKIYEVINNVEPVAITGELLEMGARL